MIIIELLARIQYQTDQGELFSSARSSERKSLLMRHNTDEYILNGSSCWNYKSSSVLVFYDGLNFEKGLIEARGHKK